MSNKLSESFNWFLFKCGLLFSTFYSIEVFLFSSSFRVIYLLLPIMILCLWKNFYINHKNIYKYLGSYLFFLIYIFHIGYGILSLSFSYYLDGTTRLIFSQLINSLFFIYYFSFFIIYPRKIFLFFKFLVRFYKFFCFCTVFQWFLALFSVVPIGHIGYGIMNVGRPELFFKDPNWLQFFIIFLYLIIFQFYRDGYCTKRNIRIIIIYLFITLLFTQSRIEILLCSLHLILFYFNFKNKIIPIVLTLFISIFILFFFLDPIVLFKILPERFVYDLVDMDSTNPRLHDSINLIESIKYYKRQVWGFGWGALGFISDSYSYRNYDITINVYPVQIYFDLGFVGLCFWGLIFIYSLFTFKDFHLLFIFIFFILNCCFHMPGYFTYTWILLGIYSFLCRAKSLKSHR